MLYAASLAVGLWASYDTAAAVQRAVLLAAGLALIPLASGSRPCGSATLRYFGLDRKLGLDRAMEGLIACFASVVAAGIAIAWFEFPGAINANVCASFLAVLFPFTAAAIIRSFRRRANGHLIAHTILALPAIAALLLTGSHGAWAGLLAAALVVALLAVLGERGRRPVAAGALTSALILLPIAVLGFALLRPDLAGVLGRVAGSDRTRAALWVDMLAQLRDVPFTGSGLAATMMTDATYVRLLFVGFISHAHHLYLQVALEQGLAGLAAFIGIQAVALYLAIRTGELSVVAAFTVLLVHGSVDAGLYVARPAPLLFFPAAVAVLLARGKAEVSLDWPIAKRPLAARPLLAAVPVIFLFLLPAVRAAFQANLGAILQSRAELARYSWPAVPIQDALRRDPATDLAPAIARFDAALELDPRNSTANRRLGQIELARGEYVAAKRHLETALAVDPTHRATRQLLGELCAISGDVRGARALWQGLDLSEGQLDARLYWYSYIGEAAKAAAIRAAQEQLARAN